MMWNKSCFFFSDFKGCVTVKWCTLSDCSFFCTLFLYFYIRQKNNIQENIEQAVGYQNIHSYIILVGLQSQWQLSEQLLWTYTQSIFPSSVSIYQSVSLVSLSDCSVCFYSPGHYVHITSDNLSKMELCSYVLKVPVVTVFPTESECNCGGGCSCSLDVTWWKIGFICTWSALHWFWVSLSVV